MGSAHDSALFAFFFQKLSKKTAAGTIEHTLAATPENRIDISASHIANNECTLGLIGGAVGIKDSKLRCSRRHFGMGVEEHKD